VAIEAVESLQSEVKKIDPARSLTATEQSKLSHVKNVVELHNETTRGHQCHVFDGVFDATWCMFTVGTIERILMWIQTCCECPIRRARNEIRQASPGATRAVEGDALRLGPNDSSCALSSCYAQMQPSANMRTWEGYSLVSLP
jgi:hypothetical protein